MSDLEKAARMALEAICGSGDFLFNWHDCEPNNEREVQAYQAALAANEKAFNALSQALEQPQDEWLTGCPECGMDGECGCDKQPAQQGPVAWVREHELPLAPGDAFSWVETFVHKTPLYTSPQRKPWVGLTDAERKRAIQFNNAHEALAVVIEAKLKEKNA